MSAPMPGAFDTSSRSSPRQSVRSPSDLIPMSVDMDNPSIPRPLDTLPGALAQRTRDALDCGALRRVETDQQIIEDAGVRFLVRKLSSLARKDEDRKRREQASANPFLPYEQDLFVADISPTHVALLNKFNVIDRHLLVVTRRFEPQEALLNRADFEALALCLGALEGLGFYNGGSVAGASQPHKHLQWVPLPLGQGVAAVPMEPLFEAVRGRGEICAVPGLPFRHAFSWLESTLFGDPVNAADMVLARYRELLARSGSGSIEQGGAALQSAPYNLLLTRRWMLLVPRRRECVESISVNALGFA